MEMKHPLLPTALLLSALPAMADDDMASERMKGYNYGYIYGLGNALCALVLENRIDNEYAHDLLLGAVGALSDNPEHELYTAYAADRREAYQAITEDVVCKEVYQ